MDPNLIQRITIDPDICHGKPTVRGMRYPVSMILDLLGAGMTRNPSRENIPLAYWSVTELPGNSVHFCFSNAFWWNSKAVLHSLLAS